MAVTNPLLRCNPLTQLMFPGVGRIIRRDRDAKLWTTLVFCALFRGVSHDHCLLTQCEKKDAKLSICSLVPYQNEMLMPHCRHDFVESCRSWALLDMGAVRGDTVRVEAVKVDLA